MGSSNQRRRIHEQQRHMVGVGASPKPFVGFPPPPEPIDLLAKLTFFFRLIEPGATSDDYRSLGDPHLPAGRLGQGPLLIFISDYAKIWAWALPPLGAQRVLPGCDSTSELSGRVGSV